jgi:signal transduction histidine kinase
MSSPEAFTLLGVTLVLAGLIGILIVAIVRLRRRGERQAARARVSEEAFMATAIQEVLEQRGPVEVPARAPSVAIDTAIVDALPLAALVVDEAGLLRRFNAAASRLLGVTIVRPLPEPVHHVLAAHPTIVQAIDAARRSRHPSMTRVDLAADDAWRIIEVAWSPLPEAPEGKRLLVSLRDVTEAEYREAVARRRDTMAHVAQLGSSLAHELANSLTAVHGYSRMIDPSVLTPADRAALESVQKETDALGATIETFRRVSRPLDLTHDVFPLRWVVDDAAKHLVSEHRIAPSAIVSRVPDALQVEGDRVLLEDALMNLMANAIEACQEAGIEPVVSVTGTRSADGAFVHVVVEDNGPGVTETDRAQLFSLFFSTKPDHAGAGLARARHIVQSHDGTIAASHPVDGGLKVTITLPLSKTARASAATR